MTAPTQPGPWGVAAAPTRRRLTRSAARAARAVRVVVAGVATVMLGLAGAVLASTSSAHADVLGMSDSVQQWVCGIVNPSEPWEGVGDGPESWMSNRNLVGAKQVAPTLVDVSGQSYSRTAPVTDVVPDTMDQLPALPAGQYTLYEVAGLRGLSWWTIPLNPDKTRNCDLWNYIWSQAGNAVFTVSKVGLQITISIKEAAAADNPLAFLYDESSGAVGSVFTLFFIPVATLMFILAGIWLAVNALRGSGMRAALGGIGVAAGVVALAGFAYATTASGSNGFRSIAGTVDSAISQVNGVATNALFDGLTRNTGACTLPDGPSDAIRGQRLTSCVLADSLAYRPWAIGQFGGTGANPVPLPADWTVVTPGTDGTIPVDALREEKVLPCYVTAAGDCQDLRTYLIAQHGGVQVGDQLSGPNGFLKCSAGAVQAFADTPAWMMLSNALQETGQSTEPLRLAVSTPCSPMLRVFTALSESDVATAKAYAGDVGIARFTQALAALLGTAVAAVPVLITGLITMAWIALTFALYLTGPFKLAFATYTGKAKMAKEWAGDLVHAWASRLAYGILLTLTILIISWMMAATISFGLRLVWLGVILFFFWKLVQKVQEMVRPSAASLAPNLAGDLQHRSTRAARGLSRTATRATLGAGLGVAAAGERRRILAMDPTRGPARRTTGALLAPASLLAGGLRGAVGGPQSAQRSAFRTMTRAQTVTGRANAAAAKAPAAAASATSAAAGTSRAAAAGAPTRTVRAAGTVNPAAQLAGSRTATSFRVNPDRRTAGTAEPTTGRWTGVPVDDGTRPAGSRNRSAVDAATVGPVLPRRKPPVVQHLQERAAAREPSIITRRRGPDPDAPAEPKRPAPEVVDVWFTTEESESADAHDPEPAQT